MEKTGSIETFNEFLLDERSAWLEMHRSPAAVDLVVARQNIHAHLKEVGKSGDIELIVATEKALLITDLTLYANSGAMASSLKTALTELQAAEKGIPLVRDPVLYRAVDESHGHPKSRIGELPKDAPRQFFSSHAARLLNMDKSRLDNEEKASVDQRKLNMRAADKLYVTMQRKALGLAPAQERDNGLSH